MRIPIQNSIHGDSVGTNSLLEMHRKLLFRSETDCAVRAFWFDLEVGEFMPLKIKFIFESLLALFTGEIRMLFHVQREVAFQPKSLVAVLACERDVFTVGTFEICSAIGLRFSCEKNR